MTRSRSLFACLAAVMAVSVWADDAKTSTTAKANDAPKTSTTAKANDAPKTSTTAKANDTPKTSTTAKANDAPKTSTTAKANDAPKTSTTAKANDTPKTSDAPKADAPKSDALTNAVDPYDVADQKTKFITLAGKTGELDAKTFDADRKAGNNLLMPFEKWETAILFDKDKNGTLDWFEFEAYRQAMRKAVLAACDKNNDKTLTGDERTAALKLLTDGKIIIKPDPERITGLPPGFGAADAATATSQPTGGATTKPLTWEEEYIAEADQVVALSDEQKQKSRELFAAKSKAWADLEAQHGARMKELLRLMDDTTDKEKRNQAHKEYGELTAELRKTWDQLDADLRNVLTPEQKIAWRLHAIVKLAHQHYAPVTLSEEQIQKLKEVLADLLKDPTSNQPSRDHHSLVGLTVEEQMRGSNTARLLFTDEQKEQLDWKYMSDWIESTFWGTGKATAEKKKLVAAACEEVRNTGYRGMELKVKAYEKVISLLTDAEKDTGLKSRLHFVNQSVDVIAADIAGAQLTDEQKKLLNTAFKEMYEVRHDSSTPFEVVSAAFDKCLEPFVATLSASQKDTLLLSLIQRQNREWEEREKERARRESK